MSLATLLRHDVEIRNYVAGSTDDYGLGGDYGDWVSAKAFFQDDGQTELRFDAETVVADARVALFPGTTITNQSQVRHEGTIYNVISVAVRRAPQGPSHQTVYLKRVS